MTNLSWLTGKRSSTRSEKPETSGLHQEISILASKLQRIESEFAAFKSVHPARNTPPFPIWDASEPAVQAAFADLVRPTETVFDIGAHIGSLSSVLSRMVGPKGLVISFEASLATAMQLNTNLVANGHRNVSIIHGAVFSRPGEWISLSDNGAASRIVDNGIEAVETVQLDYFCTQQELSPSFIKMDIEGAEYDALLGAENILKNFKPHIIFEHNVGDDRALELLKASGYIFFDASTYRPVNSSSDCEQGAFVTNIISIHSARISDTPFRSNPIIEHVGQYKLTSKADSTALASITLDLEPGRYFFELSGALPPDAKTLFSRVSSRNRCIGQLYTDAKFFMQNHRHLPFQASQAGSYLFEVGEVDSSTGTPSMLNANLFRVRLG